MTSNCIHCMARYSKGKSERSVWFLPGPYFAIRTVYTETDISCVFLFTKVGELKINNFGASII